MPYAVYILTNKRNGTLYTGCTADLARRIQQHKEKQVKGFTKEYGCDRLVWYEFFEEKHYALVVEKRIKDWLRKWKIAMIEKENPYWNDLSEKL